MMNPFQDVFERQKRHFATGVTRSYLWRIEQLDRMARLVEENEHALQRAVSKDFKTASQEQVFETLACLGEVAFQKSQLQDWMAPTEAPVPQALAATGHRGIVYRDPYGATLIIGPFNGPLLLLRPAIAALAAGNCCVLKLSEKLNSTSALVLDLMPKYFEPDAVAAVAGEREEVTELLKLPFDLIFFTGSTSTGKVIAWGGQWCTSPGYAYVQESVAEHFVANAKEALIALYGEDPKSNPDYSRIISAREVSRLAGLIDPAKVVAGGGSDPDACYLDPTILHPIKWEDRILDEEIFGPSLPILAYRTMDEASARSPRARVRSRRSFSAATNVQSIDSQASCPLAVARSIRSTFICSWRPCLSEAWERRAWDTITAGMASKC